MTRRFRASIRRGSGRGPFALQYRRATALQRAGRRSEALSAFVQLAREYPTVPWAHFGLGDTRVSLGDLEGGVRALLESVRLFPQFKMAHYALATAYRRQGDAARSIEHLKLYEQPSAAQPPLPDNQLMAVAELELGARYYTRQAIKLAKEGDLRGAVSALEKTLELDPGLALSHVNLMTLYEKLDEWNRVEEHFEAAIRVAPNRADAYDVMAGALSRSGRHEEAEAL